MPTSRTPVVFIPGLWMHGTSWAPWAGHSLGGLMVQNLLGRGLAAAAVAIDAALVVRSCCSAGSAIRSCRWWSRPEVADTILAWLQGKAL